MGYKRKTTRQRSGDGLPAAIRRHCETEGANRESLLRYLVEEEAFSEGDASALADAVCRKLLEPPFPPIYEMELMLTEDCNQRCRYCFVEGKNEFNRMPWEVARKAVDFLFLHCRERKEVHLLFFGGEPMLEFELIERIVRYTEEKAREAGKTVHFSMTTNGTLFDESRTVFLAKHGVKFLLSVDGDRETHDRHRKTLSGESSYDLITKNLSMMKRYQPWMGTRMTVHPDTVSRVYENVIHLASLGINQFLVGPATGETWTDEGMDIYRDEMIRVIRWLKGQLEAGRRFRVSALEEDFDTLGGKRNIWGCRAGRHSLSITARGEIYACSKMVGVEDLKGICPLGTLDEGITEIYNRLALCGRIPVRREKCMRCDSIDSCMGGCFATNYQETGSIFQPDPFECRLKKRTIEITRESVRILGPLQVKRERGGIHLRPPSEGSGSGT